MKRIKSVLDKAAQNADCNRELTGIESEALERFKKHDDEIDDIIVQVIDDLDLLKEKAKNIGTAIDRNKELIDKAKTHADKTEAKIITANTKIKELIQQFSAPSKFCLYVVLVIIIVGLIMVLYNQIKGF